MAEKRKAVAKTVVIRILDNKRHQKIRQPEVIVGLT